jgi:hypothetical protein
MITSGLIGQLRAKHGDQPKAAQVIRTGNGAATLFNVGRNRVPIMENSYSVYKGTSAQTETSDYSLDKDTGDLQFVVAPTSAAPVKINFKHAFFRDKNWREAIGDGIDKMNARGFTRQIVRDTSSFVISAGKQTYDAPAGTKDVYQVLVNDGLGGISDIDGNWNWQEDAGKIVLGWKPVVAQSGAISYTRKLRKYTAVSATLDVKDDWIELLEKAAGAYYFEAYASKIATQGNASVQEGHFSYTSLRTQAKDLKEDFLQEAARMKPTAAAKDIRYDIAGGGKA